MPDVLHYKTMIYARLGELDTRTREIEHELDQPKSADLNEQAIDLEDDEVLESLGLAAEKEIALLRSALQRIDEGTYGMCQKCDEPISDARLDAVPYAAVCKVCAQTA